MTGMPWDDYAADPAQVEAVLQTVQGTPDDASPWDDYAQPEQSPGFIDRIEHAIDSSVVGDVGRSVARGGVGVGDSVMGLAGLMSGGAIPKALGYDSTGVRKFMDTQDTPERQASRQALDQASGVGGTLQALRDNPGNIPHAIVESVPSLLLGGAAGRGVALGAKALGVAPRVAGVIGAGAGEGLVGAGQQAEQTRQATGTLNPEQSGLALLSGGLTGLLGAAGARIGRKLGVADIDSIVAGADGVDVAKGLVQRALTGTGIESLEELSQSGQQQVLTNLATDRPAMEGVDKQMVIGGVVGGAMGGGASLRRPNMTTPQQTPMSMPAQQQQAQPVPGPHFVQEGIDPAEQQVSTAAHGVLSAVKNDAERKLQALKEFRDQRRPPWLFDKPTEPKTPFAGSQDVTPLLDNLGLQGEQRAQSLDLLKPAEADTEARRRGVVTMDEQRRLASLIGLEGAKAQVFSRKIGQAWSAEQTIAATDLVSNRLQSVLAQQKHIASGQATDLERANFVDSYAELQSIFGELMGARAESGRALAAQRRKVQDITQAKAILDNLKTGQNADDLALALGEAVRVGGVANATKLMAKGPGFLHKWLGTYWRSALLTGAGTHAVNATSNTGMLANEVIERGIASGIGGLKRAVGLKGETVFSEPMALLLGYAKNMTNAVGAAGQAWKTGQSNAINSSAEAYDGTFGQRPVELEDGTLTRPRQGKVDAAFDLPFRALGTSDAFYSTLNFAAELEAQARQIAVGEKRAGTLPAGTKLSQRIEQLVATPTPAMLERANQHKLQQTFQSKGGPLLGLVMAAKARAPWLHAIAPYVQTPTNVVREAMKRTPLAAAMPSVWSDFKAGGARAERAAARVIWGSTVMITAGALSQAGFLTGNGPTDEKKKEALLATGWQPNSIVVDGDYYSYQRFSPLGIILSLSADLAESWADNKDASGMVVDGLSSFSQNVTNQTFLKGIADFAQFASNPRRNGKWYASRMAGSFAQPFTLLSNAASTSDPYARESDGPLDSIMNRTPGLRTQLPAKRDAWGQTVPNAMNQYGALSMAVPVAKSTQKTDPALLEAARIGYSPGETEPHFTLNKRRFELDDKQQAEFAELSGALALKTIRSAMQGEGWRALGDDQKKSRMSAQMRKARTAVRFAFVPYLANGDRRAIDKLRSAIQQGGN
ncbi:hypothetical protein [Pseudomonas umsongensis]|uniref:Uncharacterized protein n=1 Tax=Pseudomonas umsongensis TaxID=198618 RepID=A0AAE6ZST6_9PSED|nr:hypothetical protein [Pseudomonas umsongensis]QJC78213.1 hypothetical protein HGP31_07785 [Pseudomonas umsongensis]